MTGFSNAEEDWRDSLVGQKVMPFRVEDTSEIARVAQVLIAAMGT